MSLKKSLKAKSTNVSDSQKQEFLPELSWAQKMLYNGTLAMSIMSAGNINEEPFIRRAMMEKRMKKLDLVDKEVPLEMKVNFFGDKDSENIVVSWGSPKGAIIESLNQLKDEGFSLGYIQVRMIHPLPSAYLKQMLQGKKRIIDIEENITAQLGGIITEHTTIKPNYYILKYTGRPMMTTEVYQAIKNVLTDKAPKGRCLMLGA